MKLYHKIKKKLKYNLRKYNMYYLVHFSYFLLKSKYKTIDSSAIKFNNLNSK